MIQSPYDTMLASLTDVNGIKEYREWLQARAVSDLAWKAEVKGLFEVNKPHHALIEICSQEKGEPEGLFKVPSSVEPGIIECAFVEYIFSGNDEKRTCENICRNLFAPVQKHLRGSNDILVIRVESCKLPPTYNDAQFVFTALRSRIEPNQLHEAIFGSFGHYDTLPPTEELESGLNASGLIVIVKNGGFITGGHNTNLESKLSGLLKSKRHQHREKYPDALTIVYILVDCPPTVLCRINHNALSAKVGHNEILVYSSIGFSSGRAVETKFVAAGVGAPTLDFRNSIIDDITERKCKYE